MNEFWSDHVQGVMTLYLSRKLRFDDQFFEQYRQLFALDENADLQVLEIGCGPGALAESLHRWFPHAEITAIDRDSRFISFAKSNIPGIDLREGDATCLPFEDRRAFGGIHDDRSRFGRCFAEGSRDLPKDRGKCRHCVPDSG